jgi:uncharacterized protein involved in exopolysaccharide biosynthesis
MDFTPFFQKKFITWLVSGAIGLFILVYLITSPLIIQPIYKAEALIYVPLTLFTQQYDQGGIGFGGDAEIDAHIQIMLSNFMMDSLLASFDLANQWGLDKTKNGAQAILYNKLRKNLDVQKNRYGSVSIKVSHPDAITAANMANDMVHIADVIKEKMLQQNRYKAYQFAKERYDEKLYEIESMENSGEEMMGFIQKNSGDRNMAILRQRTLYEAELWELTSLKNQYEKMRKSIDAPQPKSYIVSPAVPPAHPAWPPRLVISFAVVLIYVVLMVFVQIIKQDLKDAKTD